MSLEIIDMGEACRYLFEQNEEIVVDMSYQKGEHIGTIKLEELQTAYQHQATEILAKIIWNARDEQLTMLVVKMNHMIGMDIQEMKGWLQIQGFEWLDGHWIYSLNDAFNYAKVDEKPWIREELKEIKKA